MTNTSAPGAPVADNTNIVTAGPGGATLLQDIRAEDAR
jgi:catalase